MRERYRQLRAGTGARLPLATTFSHPTDPRNHALRVQTAGPGEPLQRQEVEPLTPGPGELVLEVLHSGLCHSDLSMIDNAWGMSSYPLVAGHEAVGRVAAVGDGVDPAYIGQLRGLGWFAGSCGHCFQCLAGRANLCSRAESTIVGRAGAFASEVKARQDWAIPLPELSLSPMPARCSAAASRCSRR